jgi:hypothetical protein
VKAYGIDIHDNLFPYDIKLNDTLSPNELVSELSAYQSDDKPNLGQIKFYNFVEEWIYDADAFAFEKKVIAYWPVREYLSREDEGDGKLRRKIAFTILNQENIKSSAMIPLMQVNTEFGFEFPDKYVPQAYDGEIGKYEPMPEHLYGQDLGPHGDIDIQILKVEMSKALKNQTNN